MQLADVVWLLFLTVSFSVLWDYFTYADRQDKWEREHPGQTYIRGYKTTMRKSERMKRKNGVL